MLAPIVFVLGKGGVGRSTIAAALAQAIAAQGQHALIVQWSVTDAISPWFGHPAAGYAAHALAPHVATMNFRLEDALEQYFVDHLHARAFYRVVIANRHVQRAIRAAPGLDELMFLGTVMWFATLAGQERGWTYDRIIIDAPAMGHGLSLLAVPRIASSLVFGGLLASECERVTTMVADSRRTSALVVTSLDELAVEETLEFWPRITSELGRPPVALVVNHSTAALGPLPVDMDAYLEATKCPEQPGCRAALSDRLAQLARTSRREDEIVRQLGSQTTIARIDDARYDDDAPTPRTIISHAAEALAPLVNPR